MIVFEKELASDILKILKEDQFHVFAYSTIMLVYRTSIVSIRV